MGEHAPLSPSNKRWPKCAGSIREEAVYPDISGPSAIDGTGTHWLLEECLNREDPEVLAIGRTFGQGHPDKPKGWVLKRDRAIRVNVVLDYITRRKKELLEQYPEHVVSVQAESKSHPGKLYDRTDWWGTVDVTITVKNKHGFFPIFTEVIDLKDGRTYVSEKDNSQLIAYLGGVASKNNRMTIVQPKTNPPIRYVDIRSTELKIELDKLAEAAKKTDDPNAPLIPDDKNGKGHCLYCKHKANCLARKDQLIGGLKMLDTTGTSLVDAIGKTFGDVTKMDDETLAQMLDARKVLIEVFDKAQAEAVTRLGNGQNVPGYGMRPGKRSKKWNLSEEELYKKLQAVRLKKADIYIPTLISPAQVLDHDALTDKQKERIERDYIEIVPGKLTLKPVSKVDEELQIIDGFKAYVSQCSTDSFLTEPSFL